MAPPADLIDPGPHRHVVCIYEDHAGLARQVATWVGVALSQEGVGVLVGTPAHLSAILDALRAGGHDVDALRRDQRLRLVDASEAFATLVQEPALDRPALERFVDAAMAPVVEARRRGVPVRLWGEMVDLLTRSGRRAAAARLEAVWNDRIDRHAFHVLCSYEIDQLSPEAHAGPLRDACVGHSLLVPEEDAAALDAAVSDALVEVYGEDRAPLLRQAWSGTRMFPATMPAAALVLARAQEADRANGQRLLDAVRRNLRPARA